MPGSQIWKSFSFDASRRICRFLFERTQLDGDYREAERKMRDVARHSLALQVHVRSFLSPIIARGTQEDINALAGIRRNERLN